MAMRVPTYDSFQATPSVLPQEKMTAPDMVDSGQAATKMGTALESAGQGMGRIALDMQHQANQVLVTYGLNQARQKYLDLKFDKNEGFLAKSELDALKRPSGMPLDEEYTNKFREAIGGISSQLGNDEQRRIFNEHADALLGHFQSEVGQHMFNEHNKFSLSVNNGAVKLGADAALLHWNDSNAVDSEIKIIEASVNEVGRINGTSANEVSANTKAITSGIRLGVIKAALQNNKPGYAEEYLTKYASQMNAEDVLAVRGHITKERDSQVSMLAARDTMGQFQNRIHPTDNDRAFNIAIGQESGGRQFAANGQPLTSSKGALGIAQVMPSTGPEAAKLAGVEWDEQRFRTDEKYNLALGKAYFNHQLVTHGGRLEEAYAAYNAGAGRVSDAKNQAWLKGNEDKWLDFMPEETRNYVTKNMKVYNLGQGTPPRPTFQEVDAALRDDPRLADNPARYKQARMEAETLFNEQSQAIKQREEESVATAMRGLIQNGGHYSELPVDIRSTIPPREVAGVMGFAQRVARGDDSTSPAVYNKLTSHPEELAKMTDNQFLILQGDLSENDFKHFSQVRAGLMGNGSNGIGDLNSTAIKQHLDIRLRLLGIDPTPKETATAETARLGGIRKFVNDYFTAAQKEEGKKFNDAEVEKRLDGLFAKQVVVENLFSSPSVPMLSMKIGDIRHLDKSKIIAEYNRRGISKPTDTQIMDSYWRLRVR
ncbi:Transglycosylase SLT domain-containing protein [Gammaproteobacteria bacterium]